MNAPTVSPATKQRFNKAIDIYPEWESKGWIKPHPNIVRGFEVRSRTGEQLYTVVLGIKKERCGCEDYFRKHENCVHIFLAAIYETKHDSH